MKMNPDPKIFVVEDNPMYQALVMKELSALSSDIRVFSTGENFLDQISENPDVVILDYNLEGHINGYDVLVELKKQSSPSPVIFFSSQTEQAVTDSVRRMGVADYIEKNLFSLRKLRSSIYSILSSSPDGYIA
jgi:DNA-binding response OmpR family regulator